MTPILVYSRQHRVIHSRYSAGFTLLEIMLVLSIIALASVLVVPNMGGLESRSFSAQVRQATSLLNYARRTAVVRGQPSTVSFYAGSPDDDDMSPPSSSTAGSWESGEATLVFIDSTERELEIEDRLDITFYPEGGSTGGTLLLTFEEQEVSIIVDPFTGRISIGEEED